MHNRVRYEVWMFELEGAELRYDGFGGDCDGIF